MSRVTDHTRTEKIGGDSINFCGLPSRAGNRYDIIHMSRDNDQIIFILPSLPYFRSSHKSVITVSRSTWKITKTNGVATDLFCTGVIGHPGHMFLN